VITDSEIKGQIKFKTDETNEVCTIVKGNLVLQFWNGGRLDDVL